VGTAGTFRTNLGIYNPNPLEAKVHLDLHDETGNLLSSLELNVPAHGLVQVNRISEAFPGIPAGSLDSGYITLQSGQAILGWASKIENSTSDPSMIIAEP
jgi:hypothetical protein